MIFARLTTDTGSVEWEYMKTIISLTFGLLLAISGATTVSAQVYSASLSYYPYNSNYNTNYTSNRPSNCMYATTYPNTGCDSQNNYHASYYYTSGCYTYYYNGYTRTTSIISNSCQNQNSYTYTTPTNYSYYTSPYYTYNYSNGSWSPSYSNNMYGNNNGYTNTGYGYNYGTNYTYDTNYNYGYNYDNYDYGSYNGFVHTPQNPCYYTTDGYYTCQ